MAASKKTTKKGKGTSLALTRNAEKVAKRAARDAEAEARGLLDEIRDKQRTIASAFYDIGVALKALTAPRLYGALGYKSFEAMTTKELGMSAAKALQLIAIPTQLTRKRALSLGQSKSAALIELAAATPEPDTAEALAKGTVVVRGHHAPIRPSTMSVRAIQQAARVERRSHRKDVDDESPVAAAEAWIERATKALAAVDPHGELSLKNMRRKGEAPQLELVVRCAFEHRAAVARVLRGA